MDCFLCRPRHDLVYRQTQNFRVLFDPRPLIPAHLMITTKGHFGCAGELDPLLLQELSHLKQDLQKELEAVFGICAFYEHGRAGSCMAVDERLGASCHHMHVHALPLENCLHSDIRKTMPRACQMESVACFADYFNSFGEYLYFENGAGEAVFYPARNVMLPPHYLRTLIANALGHPERSDWESYTNESLLEEGKKRLTLLPDSKMAA